jgi:hypothetical protein
MKKGIQTILRVLILFFAITATSNTYALNYTFTGSSPADPFPTQGNFNMFVPWNWDNWDTIVSVPGFSMIIDGVAYSRVIVSANGWVALTTAGGGQLPTYFASGLPVNSLANYAGGSPLFAPLWDDHSCTLITVNYTAPIFSVRWAIKWDKTYSGNYEQLIWMSLNAFTGVVTFNYSGLIYSPPPSVSASIGITGGCGGSFYSVTPDNVPGNSTVSTTIEDSFVNYKPVDVKYVFTPVTGTLLSWTGITDTLYENGTNWGSCGPPDCSNNAHVGMAASGNMPNVTSNQSVRDLVIDSGASLRIVSPYTLSICGNFINNGTLIAEPGSTISIAGNNSHLTGNFTGTNALANLYISVTLVLQTNIDVNGNFDMSNSGSFDINGKYVKVGGFFNTRNIINQGQSTLEFIGNMNQNFNAHNSVLNKVIIQKPGGNIYLSGDMIIDTSLILNSGNIVTGLGYEVNVLLNAATAIQNYSANSYVDGFLRRKIWFGSIDFPVGDSLVPNKGLDNGYELATVEFISSTSIPDLRASFNIWIASPPMGAPGPDTCGIYLISYDNYPLYDNGYWRIEKSGPYFNGSYNLTLHNTGGANSVGIASSTIMAAPQSYNPLSSSSWNPLALCNTSSTLLLNKRDGYNNPPDSSKSFNQIYATAQGFQYSQVSIDEREFGSDFILSPNMLGGENLLNLYSEYPCKILFQIINISGQSIFTETISLNQGENLIHLNERLAKGMYMVRLEGQNKIKNMKLFVE